MADEDVFGADEAEAEGEVELTLEELAPIELYDTEQLKEEDEEAAKEEAKEEEELEATRAELPTPARAPPPRISSVRTDTELFVVRKRNEATYRDTACKAICKIKHGLRQPGAQDDGRPVSLSDWDENYKPNLGSYIKFLLSRPDQFRVVEGSGPGFYTIEDVTNNRTTVAPVKGDKGDKGKGKGKWKGEDGFKGKGKGKGKDKDGAFKGKGKDGKDGKGKGKFKGKDKSDGAQPAPFPSAGKGKGKAKAEPPSNAPTKAAKLLAAAAKEALAAEVSTQDPEFADQFPAEESFEAEGEAEVEAEAEGGEGQAEAEEAAEEEAAPEPTEEEIWASMPPLDKEEEEEQALPKTTKHGTYIDMLLAGGLLSGGQKRPGADGLGGTAKRAK